MTLVFYLHNPPMRRPSSRGNRLVFDAVLHYPNFLTVLLQLKNIPLPQLSSAACLAGRLGS